MTKGCARAAPQTSDHERPDLRRRRAVRQRRQLAEVDGAHEQRVRAREKFQNGDAQAPDVGGAGPGSAWLCRSVSNRSELMYAAHLFRIRIFSLSYFFLFRCIEIFDTNETTQDMTN